MKKLTVWLWVLSLVLGVSTSSWALLIDRGGGLIYDDALSITWLQNANLAASEDFGVTGIDINGQMTWDTANDWISGLNTANYLGYNNWRLPSLDVNGDGDVVAYWLEGELSTRDNEMGYMYRYNLGGALGDDLTGDQMIGSVSLLNIMDDYWSSTDGPSGGKRTFNFFDGTQPQAGPLNTYHAWAVRDGDVPPATIPEPGTFFLLCAGLIGLAGLGRKNR